MHGTEEASNDGRVSVCIIHGLNISHKELTYLLQKFISNQNKVLHAYSQGDRLVGKDHRSSPTATHKEDNQKINHASTSSHNGSLYVHATGITNSFYQSTITHQHDSNSPSLYLKTNARNQTSHLFNALYVKVLIISLLDAHHIRTKLIT